MEVAEADFARFFCSRDFTRLVRLRHSCSRLGFAVQQEFLREFGNLATFSFAFSIMGVSSSIGITFTTPMTLGGPASVVWCWFIGAFFSFFIGTAIAELVSAYPTSGAL